MALWERPTEIFETLECGGYLVQYKQYMLEKPPSYFYDLKPEYQMFSLRSSDQIQRRRARTDAELPGRQIII